MNMIEAFKQKVLKLEKLTYREALELSKLADKEALYKAADEIRRQFCKNVIDLCSITNAKSGNCTQDCKWCPQSVHHKSPIEEYEIVDSKRAVNEALNNAKLGVARHSLVTSGRSVSDKTLDNLIPIYQEISRLSPISLCASMGLINAGQMQRLKDEANIQHYHCNLETAPSFFPNLVSTHTIEEKIETIKLARKTGLKVCSGGIIGMGETMAQRIELAITLRDLDIQSIPINILQPMKGTPLQDMAPLSEEEILTTIAIFRFINPTAQLRFAGGRMLIKTFQHKALHAGISGALTGNYLTSTGSNIKEDIKDFTYAGFTIKNENQ
jgi:biotin synthase